MPTIVRSGYGARRWMRALRDRGATTLPPDNVPVKGHCVGSVGRAFCNGPAGYYDAHTLIAAVKAAGKLRPGTPPPGGIPLWRGGRNGHAAVMDTYGYVWTTDLPYTGKIGRVKLSTPHTRWGYTYVGWCYAADIPGWHPK